MIQEFLNSLAAIAPPVGEGAYAFIDAERHCRGWVHHKQVGITDKSSNDQISIKKIPPTLSPAIDTSFRQRRRD
jgi:hypothetical protein